jgi:LuxR family maltose regulon positive regulatory protein
LARLRARGQLTELRAADLRFTPAEAAEFLNETMGLNLAPKEIGALEARTEGWIAGLQLAALSMQGRADTAGFIEAFTGSHRFVLDYLVEEVLQRQPEDIRSFMLQTAILDRLNGSLCDAVTGYENSREVLASLERGNLFVVALDDKRQWYRYHHLLAEVLQTRLLEAQPGQAPILHRRASTWYERNGLPGDAIRHALAAADFERAAGLIELEVGIMRGGSTQPSQEATWKGWVEALPPEVRRTRPVLSVYYAFALLPGELDAAEAHLQDAERRLVTMAEMAEPAQTLPAEGAVVNAAELQSLPGTIAVARAYRAGALGDLPGTLRYARQALERLPARDWCSGAVRQPRCWASPTGPVATWRQPTNRSPTAWPARAWPAASTPRQASAIFWPTSESRRGGCVRRQARAGRHCSSWRSRAGRRRKAQQTCTCS